MIARRQSLPPNRPHRYFAEILMATRLIAEGDGVVASGVVSVCRDDCFGAVGTVVNCGFDDFVVCFAVSGAWS